MSKNADFVAKARDIIHNEFKKLDVGDAARAYASCLARISLTLADIEEFDGDRRGHWGAIDDYLDEMQEIVYGENRD